MPVINCFCMKKNIVFKPLLAQWTFIRYNRDSLIYRGKECMQVRGTENRGVKRHGTEKPN